MKSARLSICFALIPIACVQGPATAPPPPVAAATTPEALPTLATPSPTMVEQPSKIAAAPVLPPSAGAPGSPDHAVPSPSAAKNAAAPRVRVRLDVPAGTLLQVEVRTALSSASSKTGDEVLAVLAGDVALSGFKLDKGAEVRGEVKTAVPGMGVKGRAQLVVVFDAVMESGEKLSLVTEAIDGRVAATADKNKGAVVVNKEYEIEIAPGARLTLAVIN